MAFLRECSYFFVVLLYTVSNSINRKRSQDGMKNMNKQYTYVLVGCVIALGVGTIARAQTYPSVPQVSPALVKTATSSPVNAKEAKKIKLQGAVTAMERNFEVRIALLDDLEARIATRIGKAQQEGRDMIAASAKLEEARKRIAEAKVELTNLKKANVTMVASTKPAVAFGNIRNKSVKNVTAKIKTAHAALVDAITIIKGQGVVGSATSTAR